MIVDQLFTPKLIKEGEVYDLGREYGAPPPEKKPRSQDPDDHNPYPFSPEEDEDYFREIFRKKREAADKAKDQGMAEGLGYSQDPEQAKWYHEGRRAFKGGTTGNLIQDIAKKHGCPAQWIDAFHAGYEDQQGWGKDDVNEDQLDELSFKDIQRGANKFAKGANKFTKNVADTGAAVGNAASALGGAIKQVGKTAVADPVSTAYNTTKSGLNKAANVAKGVYSDVKKGAQNVGQATNTVATDVGNAGTWAGDKVNQAGRGIANVAGGTAGALGSVAGGATTGVGRAAAKGFNTGVKNVGGNAVNRLQTNVFKPKSDPTAIKQQIDLKKQEIADLETELKTAIGGAQRTAYSGSINPATGREYTGDELRAKFGYTDTATAPDAVTPTQPAPLPNPTYGPGFGATPTNVTYGPGFGGNYYKQKTTPTKAQRDAYQKSIGAPVLPETRIATVLKKPVAEMLQMVETKEDVYRIKQFVDQTFAKYGAVNESAFEVRNKIIEHVTQVGAQRRREHARKSR